jgi:hypothetical protein
VRTFIAGHEAVTSTDFASLALGVDFELFAGVPGESAAEHAARLDAAADVLADLELNDPTTALLAAELMRLAPAPLRRRVVRVHPTMRFAEVA